MIGSVRVLIVEDDMRMAAGIRRGLHAEGIVADVATSGEDALWMAGSTKFDALVLDLVLPGIDGLETCRRLRKDQRVATRFTRIAGGDLPQHLAPGHRPADLPAVPARMRARYGQPMRGRPISGRDKRLLLRHTAPPAPSLLPSRDSERLGH